MKKIKHTIYLAGFIEAKPKDAGNWRKEITEKLISDDIEIYDPVERETQKTGKPAGEQVTYIVGLKKSGNWLRFMIEMNKVWLGAIHPTHDLIEIFKLLRYRKIIDGNSKFELDVWADFEAVIRSNWIIAVMKKDIQTVGTIIEIFIAMLFRIPVYLILDSPKTETNSTLLWMVLYSGGEIFYTANECIGFIKKQYKLKLDN